jgi:formate dehydrogenase major subunit
MASASGLNRRDFFRASAGFSLGGLLGLGLDLRAQHAEVRRFRIAGVKEVPSVCPYCAVGCGQLVAVRDKEIVNIEGNPDSPINQGTLFPKGAATYQLAVNPNRHKTVWYRAPGATEWDKTKTLDWAMDQIAQRVKQTRDESFVETRSFESLGLRTEEGAMQSAAAEAVAMAAAGGLGGTPTLPPSALPAFKKVNHTLRIGSLGGATMDNEWNYIQCKLMRALGVVYIENQARI